MTNALPLLTAIGSLLPGALAPHDRTVAGDQAPPAIVTINQSQSEHDATDRTAALFTETGLDLPHVLATQVAGVIVHIGGCTGTPITGTTFVVTAAHCVLDDDVVHRPRKVIRDGVEYTAVSVLVNPEYHNSPGPRLDAAVLVMDQVIPGPSAALADVFPAQGPVTLAGFQPVDTDGSLLRGTRYNNRPLSQGATGGVVTIATAAAGCLHLVSELEITDTQVKVPCGLIPGASGGGLFAERNGELILVGIISTVAADLTFNGVVPLAALHDLLDNPPEYTQEVVAGVPTQSNVVRS